MNMQAKDRKALAEELGLDEQYLYQCMSGRKAMKPADAVQAERASGGRLRRWDLRTADWHLIWPELVGTEGAPQVPTEEGRDAA
jgi:DNA-binding transcriptional regulator YdaS (Cro superfamily)